MATRYAAFSEENQRKAWDEFGVGRVEYGVEHHGKNVGGYWPTEDMPSSLARTLPTNPHKPEVWIYIRD